MQLNKYFKLQEFMSPRMFKRYGHKSIQFLDPRIINLMYEIREELGRPITINTWYKDPKGFKYRGFRPSGCRIGAIYSQHRFGRAVDFDVAGMSAEQVREWLFLNHSRLRKKIGVRSLTVEGQVNWVHLDIREYSIEIPFKRFDP